MTHEEKDRILRFLREPVPPGGYKDLLKIWRERARTMGPEAPVIFMEMLSIGRYDEQYASVLALREYGYEAFLLGEGKDAYFSVRAPGSTDPAIIHPLHPDDQGYRAEDGTWIES